MAGRHFSKGNRVNIVSKFEPAPFPLLLVTTLLLHPATALAQAQPGYLPEFACLMPPFGLRLPPHLPDLMQIAPVRDVEILEVEKWDTYTTTRKYVHFPGLTLGLVTFSNDPTRYMVSLAEISDARWAEISHFKVGDSTASARRKIGSSAAGDPDLKSDYGSEGGDVRFESLNGKITKIIFRCYTG